ncbi:MAG: hypothetical protein K2Y22_04430 [Candidatus Obscuribacterales bacterium]|nr:hypothetical protein [Candidatus Obscuribacterales bacterium]
MAGISHKTPLKAWQWVMDKAGWMNPTEMARASNLSDRTCHSYVYEGKQPSLEKAAQIAQAAKIDLDELAKRLVSAS